MADIEFVKDYGYPPASPLWLVWRDETPHINQVLEQHASREQAETAAARLALAFPGNEFHVLSVMSTVSTSPTVVGRRFDPSRSLPEPAPYPEFEDVEASEVIPPQPAPQLLDDEPF